MFGLVMELALVQQRMLLLEQQRILLAARVPLNQIYGVQVVRPTLLPPFEHAAFDQFTHLGPRCAYCALRGHTARCEGCGAPR